MSADPAAGRSRFSFARTYAIALKEFVQMRRDRLTFAMIVGIPIAQVLLFGFVINTDPKGLPTAVVDYDRSEFTRSITHTLQNTGYFAIVEAPQSAAAADAAYTQLIGAGVETLYDDRDERGGVKLGSMDLIGLPWQVIIGPRGIANGAVELKRRSTGEREELSLESAVARLSE